MNTTFHPLCKNPMTSSMGQKRLKVESWAGSARRRGSVDCPMPGKAGAGSEVSSVADYSLDRPPTRDTNTFLLREQSTASSHIDCSNYQDKLQGWSAVFHDNAIVAPRPGTSLNPTRPLNMHGELDRDMSFLTANKGAAFPAKPRELYNPLDGMMPSNKLVAQRKYYVLPSIGHQNDLFLRRQRSNMETLNQLDYARDNYEDDAEFFAELIELKRESSQSGTPLPQRSGPVNLLPPIQKLRDVVRPGTNIAELDEDHFAFSDRGSPAGMSDISDVEDFRAITPDPDYANTSPRKLSESSLIQSSRSTKLSSSSSSDLLVGERMDDRVPVIVVESCEKR